MTGPVAVVGLGLIGGSLARRLQLLRIPVTGWDADAGTRAAAASAGVPVAASLPALLQQSELIVVAVPLPALDGVFAAVAADAAHAPMVTDVTSVKAPAARLAARHGLRFVGGHPMAGTAESGFAAGSTDLLDGAAWALVLDADTDLAAWLTVAAVVTALGCWVVPCTSAAHDAAVATVSHLPHVLAAALVDAAADEPLGLALAAGSFGDATRVAATEPALTAAMCGGNAEALDAVLAGCIRRLEQARGLLADPTALQAWFRGPHHVRRYWPIPPGTDGSLQIDADLPGRLLELGAAGGCIVAVENHSALARQPGRPPSDPWSPVEPKS